MARTLCHTWGDLSAAEQARALDDCYAIYSETSDTLDREEFGRRFFRPTTRLARCLDASGNIVGFSNPTILDVTICGRRQAVFSAGVYFRLGTRGGGPAAVFGLTEALRFKLRYPLRPLAYMVMASNPAPYQILLDSVPRIWPTPGRATPPDVEAAVQAVSAVRQLEAVPGDPWRVRTFVRPCDPERIRRSSRLAVSRDFFDQRNPGWSDPHASTALLVWVPLDLRNILGTIPRLVAHRFLKTRR